ncbi:MAG: hypothetical protein WC584_04715 [Candidatus Pacearchaeota archaeon]
MADFLFHKISDKEREEIKKEAKAIMDSFSKKLEKVADKIQKEPLIEREKCEREENSGKICEIDRKIMFENAPNKDDNFIIAERGSWK